MVISGTGLQIFTGRNIGIDVLLVTDNGLLLVDSGLLLGDNGLLVIDSGLLFMDSGLLVMDSGLLLMDNGLLLIDIGVICLQRFTGRDVLIEWATWLWCLVITSIVDRGGLEARFQGFLGVNILGDVRARARLRQTDSGRGNGRTNPS